MGGLQDPAIISFAELVLRPLFPVELNQINFYGFIEALYVLLIENLRFIGG